MIVVGGGLAGCEAAWQLAERGVNVILRECKPEVMSAAHSTPLLAEIVCSNSLRSDALESPAGLLKAELRAAGSLILSCADATRVPAGEALAVDRFAFARLVTARIANHPKIRLERRVVDRLPEGGDDVDVNVNVNVIIATGPLTGGRLARELGALCGRPLYFYDAIAPIIDAETIDRAIAFRASRWGRDSKASATDGAGGGTDLARGEGGNGVAGDDIGNVGLPDRGGQQGGEGGGEGAVAADAESGDYLNCPMDRDEYAAFVAAVRDGRKVAPHSFEEARYFEGCLPIEVMADRGLDVLAFGPMRPVGLTDPRTGKRPHAVVQLRPENRHLSAYNLVGFQTRLAYPDQQRIFRMIPGLGAAEFLRMGSIHRNSYVDSPRLLGRELELRQRPNIRLAGQITGVEGYIESTAMGLLAGRFAAARARGTVAAPPPPESAMGALHTHVTRARAAGESFEPMNINFGLLPPLPGRAPKRERRRLYAQRAVAAFAGWVG